MISKKILLVPMSALALTACSDDHQGTGTFLGAAIGGLLGAAVSDGDGGAIAAGMAVGGLAGHSIGRDLDEADRRRMEAAFQNSLETGQSGNQQVWQNPDSGNSGYFVPQPAYVGDAGQYCREYTQIVTIAGQEQEMYGTACRQPDGSWKVKPRTS